MTTHVQSTSILTGDTITTTTVLVDAAQMPEAEALDTLAALGFYQGAAYRPGGRAYWHDHRSKPIYVGDFPSALAALAALAPFALLHPEATE